MLDTPRTAWKKSFIISQTLKMSYKVNVNHKLFLGDTDKRMEF